MCHYVDHHHKCAPSTSVLIMVTEGMFVTTVMRVCMYVCVTCTLLYLSTHRHNTVPGTYQFFLGEDSS